MAMEPKNQDEMLETQESDKDIRKITDQNAALKASLEKISRECDELQEANAEMEHRLNIIEKSIWWRMGCPMRFMEVRVKNLLRKNSITNKILKALSSLKNLGLRATLRRLRSPLSQKKANKKFLLPPPVHEIEYQKTVSFKYSPKFSILVPLYNTPPKFLVEMLDSVVKQTYSNWELCLADGSDSEHADVEKTCLSYGQKDKRIVYKKLEKNCGISENTNACIAISTGEYISLFDHDDILHPAVLFEVAKVINEQNADFIYTDELTFSNKLSDIVNVHFKPDFAADNLRSNNYICHFSTFKRDLLEKSGYFNKDFDGSQDHDMILRLTENAEKIAHIPKILYYWRSHPNSVAQNIDSKQYAITAGIHAVEAQLDRLGMPGKVESSRVNKSVYRIRYDLVAQPLVSIIIPNKDHIKDLKTCVDSIYEKSSYSNFEIIIVENNSEDSKTFSCYETLETHKNLKVVSFDLKSAFNYSDINNFGVEQAKGEQLIFLNNDIEVISENWIEEMLMFSQRKGVGAVGAKLYYSNNTVQHGGVIVGINGVASHAHKNFGSQDPGYFGRAAYQQDFSAVTAACMMMKKSVFCEVGGFDNIFAVAFNDVDICLRIREKGYLVAWTPYAELYHHESISRGPENTPKKLKRFTKEVETFLSRWEDFLKKGDPYYNPNLTLKREDFSLMNPIPLISND